MNRKYNQGGLAFYGVRQGGDGIKGKGYFGPLAGREGTVTELSAEDESGEFPLVVPTLTAEELELLLAGKDPTSEIMNKARSWADTRRKRGKSPFAEPMELRMPKPKAEGGGVYSPRPGLVFVGQEHGAPADVPQDIRDLANQVGAFYEGSGGDKLPDIRYRGSWDDAASRSIKGYPPEYLYTIFTNTDVNRQKDALVGDGTIFNNLLKNQQQVGYFKDRRFNRKDLSNFLQSMGPEFLRDSQNPATESNVEDFLKRGEQLMWESGDTPARQLANKANESRQRWLLNQPKGVFFMGSDHVQKLKELHGAGKKAPVKKAEGGSVSLTDLPDDVTPANWREHLQNNVLADARALLGVKDGGVINLDELIEQSLKKKDGGVINLDELIEWTMAKEKHRKMKEGGGVHMQGGGNPGEVSGEMSKPKPLSIPEPITDLVEALRQQFKKEKRSMRKPGAAQDVLMRGPVAAYVGSPADIVGMGGELLDYVQKKIPALRKPASVMDTGPEKEPPMGYAPTFPLSPEGSYGTTKVQEMLGKAGLTTGEERPLFEMGAMFGAPVAGYSSLKAGKALAPTAKDMLDIQLQRMMKPYQMAIAPEGKAGKVKAPANSSGYYNPVEKAALNLQRKQGSGSAMVSDMKKTPGVNDERLAELGLGDLASRPNVTREELLAATQENRIPLRETVRKESNADTDALLDKMSDLESEMRYLDNDSREWAEADRRLTVLKKQYEQAIGSDVAMFGPRTHEGYNMPGGENYREIRVALPTANQAPIDTSGWKVVTTDNNEFTGQRFIVIYDENGNLVTQRSGFRGSDQEALDAATKDRQRALGADQNFYHRTHHGDEPNVLFHLRVADHTDVDGKKGLLIDELQSDWHQAGRDKGYGKQPQYAEGMEGREEGFLGMKEGVPDAPFKDNWYQLGLKRAIKEAADTGMDRVYLTTGKRQIDRYENALRANVDAIEYEPFKGENGELMFEISGIKNGKEVISKDNLTYKELEELVGKDMADKIKNNAGESLAKERPNRPEWMRLSGDDISIGGEGMKQYYDKNYINFLKKYAKQFDARVGETTLPGAAKTRDQLSASDMHNMMDNPEFKKILDEEFVRVANEPKVTGKVEPQGDGYFLGRTRPSGEANAWNAALKRFGGEKVYYIDITSKMRESAAKGQSYKDGGAVKSIWTVN